MANAKEEVRRILDSLPDTASLEEIQYRIYVQQKVARGLEDIEKGRVLKGSEVEKRMSKWLGR